MPTNPLFWAFLLGGAALHWCLPQRARAAWLTLLSAAFLATVDPVAAGLLGAWTVVFWFAAPLGAQARSNGLRVTSALVLAAIGALLVFKYVKPIALALAPTSGAASIVAPLGISYFTFKLIHYAIERRRGTLPPHTFCDFASYLFLFTTITAGPIERFDHYAKNRDERPSGRMVTEGLTRIAQGLVKKFVIADLLIFDRLQSGRTAAAFLESLDKSPAGDTWLYLLLSFLYIYFDFSGYTDIAIGGARLFGQGIQENFDRPLLAGDISTFWKRWHMTLAGWCQAYVYMPLIGLTRNPYMGVFATFLTMGLWHSPSWNYVAWGVYQACGVAAALKWGQMRRAKKLPPPTGFLALAWRRVLLWVFLCGTFVFSMTHDLGFGAAIRLGAAAFGVRL